MTQTFAYNPAHEILSQATSNAAFEWTLGADFTNAYSANGLDELTLIDTTSVAHDDRGNTTAVGAKTYGYDDDNRLTSASGGGLAASTLAYDPAGRLKWISSTAFRRFLYDGDQAIAEYASSNTLLRRFVPGAGADETLVWYEGSGLSNKSWIAADARGSVLAVMNSSGAATATNTYDAYGVPASTNSSLRFGYTGQMWLGEIGLYHYKARAYNPETGRFMQTDPIGYGDGLNMYAYVGNDPVNATDPSGLCTGSRILAKDGSGQCAGGGWIAGSGSVSWGYGGNRAHGGGGGNAGCKICNWNGPAIHAVPSNVWNGGIHSTSTGILSRYGYALANAQNSLMSFVQRILPRGIPRSGPTTLFQRPIPIPRPSIPYPEGDGTTSPAPGFSWRGSGPPPRQGNWYNPRTDESLHPDLNHPPGVDPHWDYNPGGGSGWWRWYPNGVLEPKSVAPGTPPPYYEPETI